MLDHDLIPLGRVEALPGPEVGCVCVRVFARVHVCVCVLVRFFSRLLFLHLN